MRLSWNHIKTWRGKRTRLGKASWRRDNGDLVGRRLWQSERKGIIGPKGQDTSFLTGLRSHCQENFGSKSCHGWKWINSKDHILHLFSFNLVQSHRNSTYPVYQTYTEKDLGNTQAISHTLVLRAFSSLFTIPMTTSLQSLSPVILKGISGCPSAY